MDSNVQHIPKELIYEMVDGTPVYYRGYEAFLNGTKELDEIMGSSVRQSNIITQLVILLGMQLDKKYRILTNEIGLQFSPNSWRAADIAIVEKQKLKQQSDPNKYLEVASEVVIEIDIKASLDQIKDVYGYFHKKTDQLLEFGVQKVIWIFTDSQKVMMAERGKSWQTFDWKNSFEIMQGVSVNVQSILDEFP